MLLSREPVTLMRAGSFAFLALLAAAAWSACATLPEGQPNPDVFADARESWTRKVEVHDGFETRFEVTATYHAEEFIEPLALSYGNAWSRGEAGRQAAISEARDKSAKFHVFTLALSTPNFRNNNIGVAGSAWYVALRGGDGKEVKAADVIRMRPTPPELLESFPYVTGFDIAYELHFPRKLKDGSPVPGPSEGASLLLSSGLGKAELRWD